MKLKIKNVRIASVVYASYHSCLPAGRPLAANRVSEAEEPYKPSKMKKKVKNKNKIIIFISLLFLPFPCFASDQSVQGSEPLKEAHIQYKQVGWQTYEFCVLTNMTDTTNLTYEWVVNNIETFNTEKLRYFFPVGNQTVKVRVADSSGNSRSDAVQLEIRFWSLKNNWFWWALYFVIILMIFYYWALKIVYLLNRRRVSREARYFLDLLDEHGWVEKIISQKLKVKSFKIKD